MNVTFDKKYEPIEPEGGANAIGTRLLSEFRAAPLRLRIVLPIYLVVSTVGGLYGGHLLTSAYSNWITWTVSLLILEPIGIASLLALLAIAFPDSAFSSMLARALNRARLAAVLVGLAVVGFFAWAAMFIAFELWNLR